MKTHTLYILCFDKPYHHARHYVGSTADFDARVAEHRTGRTTPLLKAILEAGIGFTAHIIGEGGRNEERQLKRQRNSARVCPRCKQEKKNEQRNRSKRRRERDSEKSRAERESETPF